MSRGYYTKYNSDYCALVIEHMSEGYTFDSFSGRIGVCSGTVYEWKHAHPEFDDAVAIGFRKALWFWEKVLTSAAKGETKGNAAAIIFKLKNTFRDWYKDRQEIDHSGAAVIMVSTGINQGLPDIEGVTVRPKLDVDAARKLINSGQYVDFDQIENAVVVSPENDNLSPDDIL